MTLFELTCIVTGGNKKQYWWCHWFAWIVAAVIIVYSIIIIISVLVSLFTYNNAMDNIVETEKSKRVSKDDANKYAQTIMKQEDKNGGAENVQPQVVASSPVPTPTPTPTPTQPSMTAPTSSSSQMYDGYQADNKFSFTPNVVSGSSYPSSTMSGWEPVKEQVQKPAILNGPDISQSNPSSFPEPYAMDNYSSF